MPTVISILAFAVFLGTLNLTLSFAPVHYRNKNKSYDRIHVFNDVGRVQIEVSGKHYVIEGGQIFVKESYGDSDSRLTTLIPMSNETYHFLDNFTQLTGSHTASCSITHIDDAPNFLADMQALSLETLRLRNISSHTFGWLTKTSLQYLSMRYTDIKIVAEDTLGPVQSSLMILDLSYATISVSDLRALMRSLHNDRTVDQSSNLIVLSLANLGLRVIPYEALCLVQYSLQALSLFGNNFQIVGTMLDINTADDYENNEVDSTTETAENYFSKLLEGSNTLRRDIPSTFPQMPFLNELDLRQCNITYVQPGTFKNLVNLRRLYISQNKIFVLPNYMFEGLTNLVFLDISFNKYRESKQHSSGLKLRSDSFAELYSLRTMNLSYTAIHSGCIKFLSRLPPTLTTLELFASNLSNFEDGIFTDLSNLQVLNLSYNVRLAPNLTPSIFVGLDMLQELYMARTSLHSLNPLTELSSLRLLDVNNNSIVTFEGLMEKFPLLEHLDISCNYIRSWKDKRVFTGNSRLQSVYLHSNILTWMSDGMLEDFKVLSYLTLGGNSFICNCQLKSFMECLIDMNNGTIKNHPILIDYRSNDSTYFCTDATLSTTVEFADTDSFCVEDPSHWLSAWQHGIYISMLITVCSLSLGGLIYWKWWYIRYVAVLLKNATVMSMINVENCEDRIYVYDVFVSYADANRSWVIEELIPNIEGSEGRLNICLHERDFQVGVSILENIIMGMDQSRTILLIISGCFIKSQWCQFEMHLAQHRLLETCREELVLVLLEEIPRRKRPKTLHYLMMVKTYIVWPKKSDNISAKKLFWKRLRRVITANKSKRSSVV